MEVGSNELTRPIVIGFIVRRYLDLKESINTIDLKHFPKIYFKSIELINTVDLIFKKNLDTTESNEDIILSQNVDTTELN